MVPQSLDALLLFVYLDIYSSIQNKRVSNTSCEPGGMPGLEDTASVHRRSLHPEISPSYEGDRHVNMQSEYTMGSLMIGSCEKYSRSTGDGGG